MRDPIEIERDATDRLKDVGLWVVGALLAGVAVACLFGFLGLVIGFAARVAKWVVG